MDLNLAIIGVIVLLAGSGVIGVVIAAYREGKRIGEVSKSERFDRLACRVQLAGTAWSVTCPSTDGGEVRRGTSATIRFRQYGSRIIGEGDASDGGRWSIEGSAEGRRLCCLCLEQSRTDESLAAVSLEMKSADEMTGMRTCWSPDRRGMLVQPISLQRISG